MTTPQRSGGTSRLPGNDGSWFLKAVGVATSPTELGDVAGEVDSTSELVQELWDSGVAPDALQGWVPDELSATVSSSRRFRRWPVVIATLIVVVLAAAAVWLARSSNGRAEARADDYRRVLRELRSDLPDAQRALAQLTEPSADATQFPDLIPIVTDLRADSETALDVTAAPLPSAWPLASSAPFERLEPSRAATSQLATTAQAMARRLGEVLDYRTLFSRFLATGALSTTSGADLSDLNFRLAAAAADTAALLGELPADAALARHTTQARSTLDRFVTWQVDYVDVLRTGDTGEADRLLAELEELRRRLDDTLVAAIGRIRSEVDSTIIELASSLDVAVAAVP